MGYQLTDNLNSIFYFLQLPPMLSLSSLLSTETISSQNTNPTSDDTMITSVINTEATITSAAVTTSTTKLTTTAVTWVTSSTTMTTSAVVTTSTTKIATTAVIGSTSSATITTSAAVTSSITKITTTAVLAVNSTMKITTVAAAVTTSTTKITTITSTTDPCPYTAAGRCNSTSGNDTFSLYQPIDVFVNNNGTILYVGEYGNNRVQAFQLPSKSGTTVPTSVQGVLGIYYDDNKSTLYVSEWTPAILTLWPSGKTQPLNATGSACLASGGWFGRPYGIVGDGQGTTYVSHNSCNTIVKWIPNATQPVLIGGNGSATASTMGLNSPRHMHLDEVHSFIYVADTNNHRVQRFSTSGNGPGISVAGGNGQGSALNQLNSPTGVYVSWKDGSVYVSDQNNHRIQKWLVNTTSGVTVAGYSNGSSGTGPFALNKPFAVTFDPNETYMYIADYNNNRVQRYPVV